MPPPSWPQPETSVGKRCHHCELPVVFVAKIVKITDFLRYFGSFNLFAVNKDILYFVE